MHPTRGSTAMAAGVCPPLRRGELEIAIAPSAVRVARRWTAERLAATAPPPSADLIDAAILTVSELVTNAIQAVRLAGPQPGSRVCLTITRVGQIVRIEVHDTSCAALPPGRQRDDDDEGGRGLIVVAALCASWGWRQGPLGKVVWCELDLAGRAASVPASASRSTD